MQPAMQYHVFPVLCLAAFLGAASGLTVERVSIVNNRTYISYGLGASANNSLLECIHYLDEGEEVRQVSWEMWDDVDKLGTYEWRPGSGGIATGSLEGVVELNRGDESLELIKLRYDLGGMYSCGVSLTNGVTKNTVKEEVLIIDINGVSTLSTHDHDCTITSSYESPAVFPEPTLLAGTFSPKLNKYFEMVSSHDWFKVIHSNGSVTYSYSNFTPKVDSSTPDDMVLKLSMGVTKSDGKLISLSGFTSFSNSWNELGCPDVKEEDNKEVHYFPGGSATCREGRKNRTKATVTCMKGYLPESVNIVTMRCNGTSLTWEPEQGQTATIEDLVCVKDATPTDNGGGGTASGNPSLVLLSASLLGAVVLLFTFSHP